MFESLLISMVVIEPFQLGNIYVVYVMEWELAIKISQRGGVVVTKLTFSEGLNGRLYSDLALKITAKFVSQQDNSPYLSMI